MATSFAFLVLIVGTALNQQTLVTSQTCLSNPPEMNWEWDGDGYAGTLVFDAQTFTSSGDSYPTNFTTRVHNGSIPSPTLRMMRDTRYYVTLINNLGPESPNNPTTSNVLKDPNTTNLHTHGLHISPESPADDIFVTVGPGDSHTYTYDIPCDHSGGLAWYHPHHHGSTALQVGGGAAGLIVIEDDAVEEGLPSWFTDMSEILLIIQDINLGELTNLYPSNVDYLTQADSLETFYLVNGEYLPTICMTAGEWMKFRIQHVDTYNSTEMTIDGCEIELLAKDSVLIHGDDNTVPRSVSSMYFGLSSRADVAVHCPSGGSSPTTYRLEADGTLVAWIEVTGTATSPSPDTLSTFNPIRPRYLESLLDYDGLINSWTVKANDNTINGVTFSGSTNYLLSITAESINEWKVSNARTHPFHLHVYHMQVRCGGDSASDSNWQLDGDWLDTINANAVVRFRAEKYGGTVTVHCHKLRHEDQGSMGVFLVDGGCDAEDGDYGSGDPACNPDETCDGDWTTVAPTGSGTPSPTFLCR